ncbi:MAG: 50S ribosomal protein L6 [Clostridia bacterium]|nr:50S ribosomal protein L6 [Clostridia bacterium]MBR3195878.1 50S ribosomal protein L6 [Clostridia bacterium]
MSRIGKMPITIPAGVSIDISDENVVTVKGPKGELKEQISKEITVGIEDGVLSVTRSSDDKKHRALHGLSRALIMNMVTGVTDGFKKNLEMVGVGYRAQKQGNKLVLAVGYSHPVEFEEKDGITFDVPAPTQIVVNGISKQMVGEIAAKIRGVRPPEPYLGKGIKYSDEVIRRKEGKTGK